MQKTKASGALYIIFACLSWSFAGVLGKYTPWSALSITGFRALIAALVLGVYRKSFRFTKTKGTWMGAIGVAGTSLLFMFANKLTSAANAIVLQYAMPIFVILYFALALKKMPPRRDMLVALVMLIGIVLCFCQGMTGGGMLGNALALLSALTWALVFLSARRPDCDVFSYSFLGNLINAALVLTMPFDKNITFEPISFLVPALMGLCMSCGYVFFGRGMKLGISPVTAALLANVEPVLNPMWVFIFLGENPGTLTIIGAVVVLASVTAYSILQAKPS